uniref:Uncharacterized protein n=1 Tax=Panagrolaimus sp. PS1159 TaxID=55785 RepID=A0AC35F3L5_9BILA
MAKFFIVNLVIQTFILWCFVIQESQQKSLFQNQEEDDSDNLRYDSSMMYKILHEPWPIIKPSQMDYTNIVADCFQEIPYTAVDHTITLNARYLLHRIGCPLRLPSHSLVDIKEIKLKEDIGYVQIYSGKSSKEIIHTSGKLRGAEGYSFGPFEDTYVFILFRPTSKDDYIVFNIIGTYSRG